MYISYTILNQEIYKNLKFQGFVLKVFPKDWCKLGVQLGYKSTHNLNTNELNKWTS